MNGCEFLIEIKGLCLMNDDQDACFFGFTVHY